MNEQKLEFPTILDCDTGRDDALAIWLHALGKRSLVSVVASYGNTPLVNVRENTSRVLSLVGCDNVPLYTCASHPLKEHVGLKNVVIPRQDVSGNGLCNVQLPISKRSQSSDGSIDDLTQQLFQLFQKYGAIDYVITGPATNFALLCQAIGSEITSYVRSVTMMGGKFSPLWEDLPGADFNLLCDPYAIKTIFDAGVNIRFVPMNVTWLIALSLEEVEALSPNNEIAKYSKKLMVEHCKNFAPEAVFRFHDPAVILAMDHDDCFKDVRLDIVLDENSSDFARLCETDKGYAAKVYQPNSDYCEFFKDNILHTLGLELHEKP